jgi:hypothetical protein
LPKKLPSRRQYWAKIKNMRDVANQSQVNPARTRLFQVTGDRAYLQPGNLSTAQIRRAYTKVRKLQKKTYKAQRALMPRAKAEVVWASVERILEEDDESWNPYPDGFEGDGED